MKYPEVDPRLPVVAFDFDGVCASNTWPSPKLGRPDNDAFDAMCHYNALGCEVVIFTARPDEHLPEIRKWLRDYQMHNIVYEVTNRKPKASIYFDDRAIRWPL